MSSLLGWGGGRRFNPLLYLALWGCAGQWYKSMQGGDLLQAFPKGAAAFILLPTTPVPWHKAGTPPPSTAGKPGGGDGAEGLLHPTPICLGQLPQSLFLPHLKG